MEPPEGFKPSTPRLRSRDRDSNPALPLTRQARRHLRFRGLFPFNVPRVLGRTARRTLRRAAVAVSRESSVCPLRTNASLLLEGLVEVTALAEELALLDLLPEDRKRHVHPSTRVEILLPPILVIEFEIFLRSARRTGAPEEPDSLASPLAVALPVVSPVVLSTIHTCYSSTALSLSYSGALFLLALASAKLLSTGIVYALPFVWLAEEAACAAGLRATTLVVSHESLLAAFRGAVVTLVRDHMVWSIAEVW